MTTLFESIKKVLIGLFVYFSAIAVAMSFWYENCAWYAFVLILGFVTFAYHSECTKD